MEIPESIKNELTLCQQKLRGAVGLHQRLYRKLLANPKDKREINEKLLNAQKLIKAIAKQQKPLILSLRDELDKYHEKLKKENKPINYDADTAFIELQLEEYQNERNKCKSLVDPTSRSIASANNESIDRKKPAKRASVGNYDEEPLEKQKPSIITQDSKPKSKILQERRSKLLSVLDKVCRQNAPSTSSCSSSSSTSLITDPTEVQIKIEKTSAPSSPEPIIKEEIIEMPLIAEIKEEEPDITESSLLTPSPVPEYESDIVGSTDETEAAIVPPSNNDNESAFIPVATDASVNLEDDSEIAKSDENTLEVNNKSDLNELDECKSLENVEFSELLLQPDSKEKFFRYLDIFTHEQCSKMIQARLERKKKLTINAIDPKILCKTPDNKRKRKKKLYLQQYTPPVTRRRHNVSAKNVLADNKDKIVEINKTCNSSKSSLHAEGITIIKKEPQKISEDSNTSPKIKTELSDKEDVCLVCQLNDGEAVNCCELCGEYYHLLCHGPGPLHLQKRMCPYCARRSSSPETIKGNTCGTAPFHSSFFN